MVNLAYTVSICNNKLGWQKERLRTEGSAWLLLTQHTENMCPGSRHEAGQASVGHQKGGKEERGRGCQKRLERNCQKVAGHGTGTSMPAWAIKGIGKEMEGPGLVWRLCRAYEHG